MTPRDMPTPQPAPEPGLRSVTDWLIEQTPLDRDGELGGELQSHNGRGALADQLQEAVDLLLYAAQHRIEADGRTPDMRVRLVYALVVDLARELERLPASVARRAR